MPVKQKAGVSPECSVCSTGLTILKFVVGQNATEVNIILAPGLHNSLLTSGDFCCLLKMFANSLDPDQD